MLNIRNKSSHPSFGSAITDMQYVNDTNRSYRYGFNNQEKDNEINVDRGCYDFGARIYDNRIGRWMSIDPELNKAPQYSPYVFCMNKPIIFNDPDGEWVKYCVTKYYTDKNGMPHEKKWYNILKKTTAIDIVATVHNLKIFAKDILIEEKVIEPLVDENGPILDEITGRQLTKTTIRKRPPNEIEKKQVIDNIKAEAIKYFTGKALSNKRGNKTVSVRVEFATEPTFVNSLSEVKNFSFRGRVDDLVTLRNELYEADGEPADGLTHSRNHMSLTWSTIYNKEGTWAHEFVHESKQSFIRSLIIDDHSERGIFNSDGTNVSLGPNFTNLRSAKKRNEIFFLKY